RSLRATRHLIVDSNCRSLQSDCHPLLPRLFSCGSSRQNRQQPLASRDRRRNVVAGGFSNSRAALRSSARAHLARRDVWILSDGRSNRRNEASRSIAVPVFARIYFRAPILVSARTVKIRIVAASVAITRPLALSRFLIGGL